MIEAPGTPRTPESASAKRAGRLERAWPVLALLGFALVAIGPLLQPGYFWGAHDARHDVYFLFQYDLSVQEGNWFPRWGPDWAFGYGYPFWIIYAPLAVFTGELIHHFLGFGWEDSVKAVLGLSIVLSGLGMFGFARSWLGERAALVAAVAYMVIPYHLVDVYVRAAAPESLALAIMPLVLWAFRALVQRPTLLGVLVGAAVYSTLWWTHNLTAAIFTPALALYVLVLALRRPAQAEDPAGNSGDSLLRRALGRALPCAAAGLLAFGLTAVFLAPALLESRNVNQTQWFGQYYNPFQHFVYFNQLFSPAWGFGISQPGPDDVAQGGLSYQLGAVPLVLGALSLLTVRRLSAGRRVELLGFALWAAVATFLTLGISAPAWRLPVVPYAQFPWRYLMLAILPLSILAGSLLVHQKDEDPGPAWPALLLALLVLFGSYPYLRAEMREPTVEQGPVSYAALMRFQRTSNEMTGVTTWVDPGSIPNWSPMADEWVAGREVRTKVDYQQVPQSDTLAVNAEELGSAHEMIWYHAGAEGQAITFNRFWYPGWKAYLLDGKAGRPVSELAVRREDGPLARIVVPVPAGESYLLLRFEDTPLRAGAKAVTLIAGALWIGLACWVLWQRAGRRLARTARARAT